MYLCPDRLAKSVSLLPLSSTIVGDNGRRHCLLLLSPNIVSDHCIVSYPCLLPLSPTIVSINSAVSPSTITFPSIIYQEHWITSAIAKLVTKTPIAQPR